MSLALHNSACDELHDDAAAPDKMDVLWEMVAKIAARVLAVDEATAKLNKALELKTPRIRRARVDACTAARAESLRRLANLADELSALAR